jgi:hypothetical protein
VYVCTQMNRHPRCCADLGERCDLADPPLTKTNGALVRARRLEARAMASKSGQVAIEARSWEHMERDQSQPAVKHCALQSTLAVTHLSWWIGGHSFRLHTP